MKLNLGCGNRKIPDWVNADVDRGCSPDICMDLQSSLWPWDDNSVDEVALVHVLEHIHDLKTVMQELYRVCKPGARVYISVPHPRHDDYLDDPTHVRPITVNLLATMDKALNLKWKEAGLSNSPIALMWGVDFRLRSVDHTPDPAYVEGLKAGTIDENDLRAAARDLNNVIKESRFVLEVVK